MNASAYLKGHGWRGDGFSLDASDRGLAKPLLVSHKLDLAGLGTKKNDFSNQWWLTSFDKSLQAIGNKVSPVEVKAPVVQKSGLYSKFVKAETLESTIKLDFQPAPPVESQLNGIAPESIMSMSTLPPGFVLGESPSASSFTPPIITTREKRGKKRKHDEGTTAQETPSSVVTEVNALAEKKREKKGKKEEKNGELPVEAQIANNAATITMAGATVEAKKEKRSKKKDKLTDVPTRLAAEQLEAPVEAVEKVLKKDKKSKRKAEDVVDAAALDGKAVIAELAEKASKKEKRSRKKKENGVDDAGPNGALLLQGPEAEQSKTDVKEISTEFVEDSLPKPPQEAGYISLVDPSDVSTKKVKSKKQKVEKPEPTASDVALGLPDAKGIPTVHPKTGALLTKKARKIIARRKSKMEMKEGRAEVRARRQAKKAERAKQAALKKRGDGEAAPAQVKEKKSEKYARQKALRVARRETKENFAAGKGTGANGTPLA